VVATEWLDGREAEAARKIATTLLLPPQKFLEELFGYRWGGQKIADCRLPRAGRIGH